MIKICVVSDLHPQLSSEKPDSSFIIDTETSKLKEWSAPDEIFSLIASENLCADYLVCSGDIGDQGDPSKLQIGWEYLHKLAGALNVKRVIPVPGNHDHDSRLKFSKYDPKHHIQKIKPYFPFSDYEQNSHFWSWHWACEEQNDVFFFAVNSSAFHGVREESGKYMVDEVTHGRISPTSIKTINRRLKTVPTNAIKILVTHHHPFKIGSVNYPDYQAMDGGEALLDMISSNGGNWLIIHGHLHYPRLFSAPSSQGDPPIIFSSGSFSGPLDTAYHKDISNQFYIMELHDEKLSSMGLVGRFKSWDWNLREGWRPAFCEKGLPANGGFGYRRNIQSLVADLVLRMQGAMSLTRDEILEIDPNVRYLTPGDLKDLQRRLDEQGYNLALDQGDIADIAINFEGSTQ